MVEVTVEFEGQVREVLAEHIRKFTLERDNVGELTDALRKRYGEGIEALMIEPRTDQYYDQHVQILINGTGTKDLQGLDTILKDGDNVMVTSIVGGM